MIFILNKKQIFWKMFNGISIDQIKVWCEKYFISFTDSPPVNCGYQNLSISTKNMQK